ncbi:MAG: universal stress protein, partial [Vitreimonas sp.]
VCRTGILSPRQKGRLRMPFGDIMAIVLSTRADEPVLATAEALSDAHDVHVSATLVSVAPHSAYGFDTVGVAVAAGAWSEPPAAVYRDADDEHVKLIRRLERFSRPVRVERVEYGEGAGTELAGVQSRRTGLTILLRPRGAPDAPLRTAMFERVLFESGRPVLLVPPGWRQKTLGRTILVAWNGSREATRALADAQPLLAAAENVFLVTIQGEIRGGLAIADIAAYLRRLGLRCQQRTVPRSERATIAALLEECDAVGADLMVMGGYGHSRLQEKLFGGVTQSLVATSPTPLLISR